MNWVSVEDELPNELEKVLVSYGTLKAIAYFEYDDDKNICWFDAGSQHGQQWSKSPRFWMRIPAEPEIV